MKYKTYKQFIVEESIVHNTLIFRVWQPIKKGRYFKDVKKINGFLYGRMGTKYPYIKKTRIMNHLNHVAYKKQIEQASQSQAYEIISICNPDILQDKHMLVDGEVLVPIINNTNSNWN